MSRFLLPTPQVVVAYQELRSRVVELLRSVPESEGDRAVPHCPAWTVRDLVAHMVGIPEDILAGRMEGVTTDAWTHAQVERHRGESLHELASSFESSREQFDSVLPMIPAPTNSQLVMDAVTHEHDLRHALGRPGARDSSAVAVGVGWLLDMAERNAPGLASVLSAPGTDRFEVMRTMSGRRSPEQIARMGFDEGQILSLLIGTPLKPPAVSIEE